MPVSRYSRYYGLDSVERDRKVSLVQRLTLPATAPADSISHTLVGGETLEQLAARYYGREDLWWRIADANRTRFPFDWRPGDTVVVPPVRIATQVPRSR
jgi:nucleoid-associated protein YgaU